MASPDVMVGNFGGNKGVCFPPPRSPRELVRAALSVSVGRACKGGDIELEPDLQASPTPNPSAAAMAESGDSSPNSAAALEDSLHESELEDAVVHAPLHPSKMRLMVSYGGRIQPRPHGNQLAYINGETKILSLERPLVFADFGGFVKSWVAAGPWNPSELKDGRGELRRVVLEDVAGGR